MATIDEEVEVIHELSQRLTKQNIEKLQNALDMPSGMREQIGTDSIDFFTTLKEDWEDFKPGRFHTCLHAIGRADLVPIASRIPWLCIPPAKEIEIGATRNTKTFLNLLKNELESRNWKLIMMTISLKSMGEINVQKAMESCIEKGLFANDLEKLCSILDRIGRVDLVEKIIPYKAIFAGFSDRELKRNLISDLCEKVAKDNEWQKELRKFILNENKDVSILLDHKSIPIESVYTPLTVIQVKPNMETKVEESVLNEIEFLRNIHKQVELETVEVIDFEEIVIECDSNDNKLWCLVGHPGSGKSFLCKHFGYMYGTHTLNNFQYTVSIPCRSREWHLLEEERHEKKQVGNSRFIVSWLQLSMSTDAKWSKALSEHLIESDGEGLFIIMDGADEFTRSVPFETTLLCKLLQRQFLTRSTILVTSRPSAWYDFKYTYSAQFQIDSNFQVLGFSPANRDLYFEKRIITKLNDVKMFDYHDEIKQLSLVPVNASLFSALFNETESILIQTLSHLYTQLIVCIVRRQLSRMGLKEQSKILVMSKFRKAIRDCIHTIALEANQGIFERELTSDKNISLTIDDKVYDSERLGLMQVHMKLRFGVRVKVWTFQHLTIQEYMAAVSICNNSWTTQCFILRYLTSSVQGLAMYKMVIRFMGGILRQDAGHMAPILCRHTLPKPLSLRDAPMHSQLYYGTALVDMSDWKEFTQSYLLLTTVINEISSHSVLTKHFEYFKKELPDPLCLYFLSTISPNEWHCFIQSLHHIPDFEIILIQSDYVTPVQFQSFLSLPKLASCSIHYLALMLVEEDFKSIDAYTSILSTVTLPPNTKISVCFVECSLITTHPLHLFSQSNKLTGSLRIYQTVINNKILQSLINRFDHLENFYYSPIKNSESFEMDFRYQVLTIQDLARNHELNGLYIDDSKYFLELDHEMPSYMLKELDWTTADAYAILPHLEDFSSLTYLSLFSTCQRDSSEIESRRNSLTKLFESNFDSFKEIYLDELHTVGFHCWSSFLNCIASCSNLMTLRLSNSNFIPDNVDCWPNTISALRSLVYLSFFAIPLYDSGMEALCRSLANHSAIRRLGVRRCELSFASCDPLSCLIPTLPKIRILELFECEPSKPEPSKPELSECEPSKPEPSKPEPSKPELSECEPSKPEPSKPEPSKPELSECEPSKPEPSKPEPSKPELSECELSECEPSKPEPSKPELSECEPSKPELSECEPSKPELSECELSECEPSKPEPSKPEPSKPEPSKPELSECEPSKPEPSKPEPSKPELSECEPSKPEPSKPEPSKPELSECELSECEPSKPEPSKPELSECEPSKPELSECELSECEPSKPEPSKPEPSKPEPSKPELSECEPSKPEPSKSKLSVPDSEPLQRLIKTAKKYSVKFKFED